MRTSGAEPTEVGMVGVSAESAVHYTARQALCLMLTRVTRPRIRLSFTRLVVPRCLHRLRAQGRAAGSFARTGVRQTRLWGALQRAP